MLMKQKQILFIYPSFSTFAEKDYISLIKKTEIIPYAYHPEKKILYFIYELLKLKIFLIKKIRKTEIIYCWFADYHSVLPMLFGKIFNKKRILIVGGNDAVSVPEIKYGIFYKRGFRRLSAKLTYKFSSLILPVHKSLIQGINYYADNTGLKTGFLNYVKKVKADIFELPTGYDKNKWKLKNGIKKQQAVLTIASVKNLKTYKLKGFDLYTNVARKLPEIKFIIIGVSSEIHEFIKKDKPENLIVHEYIENSRLVDYMAASKVYCQFSLSEGLPNVLCEAMLCECIPVGSDVNGIPDGIGTNGFILKERDVNQATELVKKALMSDAALGKKARQHIIDNYSHEKREESLYKLLDL